MCLAQGLNAVPPARLEPTALRSRVKHSTAKPLAIDSQTGIIEVSIYNTWMRIMSTYLSRDTRFPTKWHVDKCRPMRAYAATF